MHTLEVFFYYDIGCVYMNMYAHIEHGKSCLRFHVETHDASQICRLNRRNLEHFSSQDYRWIRPNSTQLAQSGYGAGEAGGGDKGPGVGAPAESQTGARGSAGAWFDGSGDGLRSSRSRGNRRGTFHNLGLAIIYIYVCI